MKSLYNPLKYTIRIVFLVICFLKCSTGYAQNIDSIQKEQLAFQKFSDSLYAHTTLKEFRDFLYNKITGKWYNEGRFDEHFIYYAREKYAAWIQSKKKQK